MQLHNHRVLWALITAVALTGLGSCSSDDDPSNPGPDPAPGSSLSGTIGPAGGTLVSADGNLTLVVPAGALAADTEISITEQVSAARIRARSPLGVFTTEPAGQTFAAPATLTLEGVLQTAPPPAKPGSVVLLRGFRRDALQGVVTLLDNIQHVDLNSTSVTIEILIDQFGNTIEFDTNWNGNEVTSRVDPVVEEPAQQNSVVTATPILEVSAGLDFGETVSFYPRESAGMTAITDDGASLVPASLGVGESGESRWQVAAEYQSSSATEASFRMALEYQVTPNLELLWPEPSGRPAGTGTTKVLHDLHATTIQLESVGGDGWIASGLYEIESGGDDLEVIPPMSTWSLGSSLAITRATGTKFYSLRESNPLALLNDDAINQFGSYWGGLPVAVGRPDYLETSIYLFQYGQSGGELYPWNAAGDFFGGGFLAESSASVTHASTWDSGLAYTVELSNKVTFLEFEDPGLFRPLITINSFPGAATSPVAAAKLLADPGAAIVLGGMPGTLWYHDLMNPGAGATKIGDLGDTPRDISLAGDLGFVSNRGSNSISVLETTPSLSVSASYTTGSQPLGIDSRVFSDGSIGVVSANWGDNSYTVARFMADGMMIDVMTNALPVGVSEASDAVWFPGESTRFGILARSGHLYVGDAATN